MRFCPKCGAELSEETGGSLKFCTVCGAAVQALVDGQSALQSPPPLQSYPQTPTQTAASQEVPSNPEPKIKRKGKRTAVLLLVAILAISLLGTAGFFTYKWYFGPEQTILRALKAGDYKTASELLDEEDAYQESETLRKELLDRVEAIRAGFQDKSITYTAATQELQDITGLNVDGVQKPVEEAHRFIDALNNSQGNFSAAEALFERGEYVEAIEKYALVIKEDANYNTARAKSDEAVDKYRQKVLSDAATYAAAGGHAEAISLLQTALGVLPGDVKLTEQIVLYQSDRKQLIEEKALSNAKAYADKGDYLAALGVIEDAVANIGMEPGLVTAQTTYREQYATAVLAKADAKSKEKDYLSALELLDEAMGIVPGDDRLAAKVKTVTQGYVESVVSQADALVKEKKYDEAIQQISLALGNVPGNKTLTDKKAAIEAQKPKKFMDACLPYETYDCDAYVNGKTFKMSGDDYTDGVYLRGEGGYAIFHNRAE